MRHISGLVGRGEQRSHNPSHKPFRRLREARRLCDAAAIRASGDADASGAHMANDLPAGGGLQRPQDRRSPRQIPAGSRLSVRPASHPTPKQIKELRKRVGVEDADLDYLLTTAGEVCEDWILRSNSLPSFLAVDAARQIALGLRLAAELTGDDLRNMQHLLPSSLGTTRDMLLVASGCEDWSEVEISTRGSFREVDELALRSMVDAWTYVSKRPPGKGIVRGAGPYQFFYYAFRNLDFRRYGGIFAEGNARVVARFFKAAFYRPLWETALERSDKAKRRRGPTDKGQVLQIP